MPLIWRYIYLRTSALIAAITALVMFTLVLFRPDEITRLAAISGTWTQMGIYFLVTLPYLLPIALPLATLGACAFTTAHLIQRKEWLALSTAGFSPWQICAPSFSLLLIVGGFNALICSEAVETAHHIAEHLKLDWAALKPLRGLQPQEPLSLGQFAVGAKKRSGESLSDLIICYARLHKDRQPTLNLICARKLNFKKNTFELLDYDWFEVKKDKIETSDSQFSLQRAQLADVPVSLLRAFLTSKQRSTTPLNRLNLKNLIRNRANHPSMSISGELIRRAASATLPLSLGLVGLWTGSSAAIGHPLSALSAAFFCAILTFLSPFLGKALSGHWQSAFATQFGIQAIAIVLSLRRLQRFSLGESV